MPSLHISQKLTLSEYGSASDLSPMLARRMDEFAYSHRAVRGHSYKL